jgi:type IV pilus assembly protein PilA
MQRSPGLSRARLSGAESEEGFTLIELMVVVVIIGILIAIAIPLYLNYENGAKNKSAASDLRGAVSAIEQCNDVNNALPVDFSTTDAPVSPCPGQTITVSSGSTLYYYANADTYMLVGYQGTGTTWYCYNSGDAGSVRTESGPLPTGYGSC